MRLALRIIASIILGALLFIPLVAAFVIANFPVSEFMHGYFLTALLALVAASFVFLGLISWFGPAIDSTQRIIASLSVLPLLTALFFAYPYTWSAAFSFWRAAIFGAVFCLLVVLCFRAKKPLLVPLFILVPILIAPFFNLLIGERGELSGMDLFVHDFLSNVPPMIFSSGAALALVHYIRAPDFSRAEALRTPHGATLSVFTKNSHMQYLLSILWLVLGGTWISAVMFLGQMVGGVQWLVHTGLGRPAAMNILMAVLCAAAGISLSVTKKLHTSIVVFSAATIFIHLFNAIAMYLALESSNRGFGTAQWLMLPFRLLAMVIPTNTAFTDRLSGNHVFFILPIASLVLLAVSVFISSMVKARVESVQ